MTYTVLVQEKAEIVVAWEEREAIAGPTKPEPQTELLTVWTEKGTIEVPQRTKMRTVRDKAAEMLPDGGVFRVLDAEAARAFRAEAEVTRRLTVAEVTGP